MKQTETAAHPTDCGPAAGATIHTLHPPRAIARRASAPEDRVALEEVGEVVAEAMGTLLRLQLGEQARARGVGRGIATSFELSQMIDTFLAIRDAERRRYCLAVLRSCAMADAEERGSAG